MRESLSHETWGTACPGGPVVEALSPATDFSALSGRRVLCIMDDDNLRISLQRYGLALSYKTLASRLTTTTRSLAPWAVLTHEADNPRRGEYLANRGWNALLLARERVVRAGVESVRGNADAELAFLAGRLVATKRFDVALIGTGDGDLGVAIGRCLAHFFHVPAMTLSVPGSSSQRLKDQRLFADRVLVGSDLVRRTGRFSWGRR